MALIQEIFCDVCNRNTWHQNGRCQDCAARDENLRIAAWEALSTEEKLQDLRRRVEALERGSSIIG